jgi:hypothetical protein
MVTKIDESTDIMSYTVEGQKIDINLRPPENMSFYCIGSVPDLKDLKESHPKVGYITYCESAREYYIYDGTEWVLLAADESDPNVLKPKFRKRTNCCNCNAPLPDGDIVQCEHCGTVQDTREERIFSNE